MLKAAGELKLIEDMAQEAVRETLSLVPVIEDVAIQSNPHPGDGGVDFVVRLSVHRRPWALACEVKSNGQPRFVLNAIYRLRDYAERYGPDITPMLVAPYLSDEARMLCRKRGVGYLDFEGNCQIAFDGIYIERNSATRPKAAKREIRSLFKPKSAQVLRVLLKVPQQTWKVVDLAREADVSLGHVSNVSNALIDREWARRDENGLRLVQPKALLDSWRDNYEPPSGERKRLYTPIHGKTFDQAARALMENASKDAVLASMSAAQWLAPYIRSSTNYLYVTQSVLPMLMSQLRAEPATKGENLVVTVLNDDGILRDVLEPSPGIFTTGLAQTYLDLSDTGERGREAADHLREERLPWTN